MLDVKQAFDRVWHPGLLFKIKRDLPQPHYALLQSYLKDRQFQVRCGEDRSAVKIIQAGVPQGSVLGPILYNLYTADMTVLQEEALLVATYADDTASSPLPKTLRTPLTAYSGSSMPSTHGSAGGTLRSTRKNPLKRPSL
ncbi:hypothetical protein KR044_007526 [Drosophila immigrans]|nr:hypothetical protein KR044_007526 [Drosophila immigrans]